MPFTKGSTNIISLYKGAQEIAAIYKGSTLVFQNARFLDTNFDYVYYSLISGSDLKDKGQAKLGKIFGNGVIENQLASITRNSGTLASVTYTNNGDNTFTLNGTANADDSFGLNDNITIPQGHKIFLKSPDGSSQTTSFMMVGNVTDYNGTGTIGTMGSGTRLFLFLRTGASFSNKLCKVMLIDLTLMFGTGNEPTTLTDNRIQKILNGGYIAYNAGTYKASQVSEIEFAPYNLFNGTLQIGGFYAQGTIDNSYKKGIVSQDYVGVISNLSYSFDVGTYIDYLSYCVCEYDKNKSFIQRTFKDKSVSNEFILTSTTKYIRLAVYDASENMTEMPDVQFCFHRTGTRTGYSPYIAPTKIELPDPLELGGAISAHNTFEVVDDYYIFTRNVWRVDLGTLNYTYDSSNNRFWAYVSDLKLFSDNVIPNVLCSDYVPIQYQYNPNYTTGVMFVNSSGNARIYFRNTSYTDANSFKTAMLGVYIHYELATPQVISIPKKHLGVVDLGSLNWWSYDSNQQRFYNDTLRNLIKIVSSTNTVGNLYCSKYLTSSLYDTIPAQNKDNLIATYNGNIYIKDLNAGTNVTDFKNSLNGVYLFYETESEVADFINKATFEKGGTVTTDSDVLPNLLIKLQKK